MAKNTNTRHHNLTTFNYVLLLLAVLMMIAAAFFGIFVILRPSKETAEADSISNTNTASEILKTEDDLKDDEKVAESSNEAKDKFDKSEEEKEKTIVDKNESGLNIAKPEISYVAVEGDKIAVGGAIVNINETSGTCTYVFTKGDSMVSASTGILPNSSYISCEAARIDKSKFTSGEWTVKIQYKSNTSEGESETQIITI